MKKFLVLLFATGLLAGCATMNRSECQNADWRMIGMEDGANGRLPSYIGQRRSACAKYNGIPDLDQYRRGHAEGLEQFCTEARGYNMGQRGCSYNGVCPPELEGAFLAGYAQGKDLHQRLEEINRISSQIESDRGKVAQLRKELTEKEGRMINDSTSPAERALLLREIKDLQDKINDLEDKIHWQKRSKEQRQLELEQSR